jgi:hypothetical protein
MGLGEGSNARLKFGRVKKKGQSLYFPLSLIAWYIIDENVDLIIRMCIKNM